MVIEPEVGLRTAGMFLLRMTVLLDMVASILTNYLGIN
jgi:hypothetical protein